MTITHDPQALYRHIEEGGCQQECPRCKTIREELEAEWVDAEPKGWICPRCQTVHAPWIDKCDCEPKALASVGPSEFK